MNLLSRIPDLKLAIRKRTIGFRIPEAPCMEAEGVAEFERRLKAADRYLEFGAGGSTIMAARLGKVGVSIEGDPHYIRDVRRKLGTIPNQIESIHVDIGRTEQWGYPQDRRPTEENVAKWVSYSMRPFENLGEEFFDLVLIDGRFRAACALRTIAEARKRNARVCMLVDDYSALEDPRTHYQVIEEYVPLIRLCGRLAVFEIDPAVPGKTPSDDVWLTYVKDCR